MSSTGLGLLIYSKNKPLVYDFFNVGCLDNDVTEKNRQDIKKAGQLVLPGFQFIPLFRLCLAGTPGSISLFISSISTGWESSSGR